MMTQTILADISAIHPEILLAVGAMALMLVGVFSKGGAFRLVSFLSVGLFAAVTAMLWQGGVVNYTERLFNDMLIGDAFAQSVKTMILLGAAASILMAVKDLEGTIMARFEYPVLVCFSVLGMFLMVSANDFLSLYVGLELSSLSLYVLASFNRNSTKSSEAGLKYFVLGAISSGLLLFGISLIYGYTGSTQFDVIQLTLSAATVPGPTPVVVVFGLALILSAMAFKISAVPFHMWTPDVYEGAPTSVTALFAIVPKVAAMALIIRLVTGPFAALTLDWTQILLVISVLSMCVGAFAALLQKNVKRLIAYSSIGNMGYVLVGVLAGDSDGLSAVLLYLGIYMMMTMGTFAILLSLRKEDSAVEQIADLSGLSKTKPFMAYSLAALMFSMSGIPPLAGFFGKLVIFQSAVSAGFIWLAVLGVLTSVVAAYYYLNIIRVMFFENADVTAGSVREALSLPAGTVIGVSMAFVLAFVLMPELFAHWATAAVAPLLR